MPCEAPVTSATRPERVMELLLVKEERVRTGNYSARIGTRRPGGMSSLTHPGPARERSLFLAPLPVTFSGMPVVPLTHASARVLEFEALRDLLHGYAWSALGSARISSLVPTSDRAWIEQQQQWTSEVREFRRCGG